MCGGGGSSFTVEKDETGSFIVSNAAQKSFEYAKRDVLYLLERLYIISMQTDVVLYGQLMTSSSNIYPTKFIKKLREF